MNKQQNIVEDELGYAVWIPDLTPNGQKVTIYTSEQDGAHKMHAESPDQSELYFEVTAYPAILDHDILVKRQQDFLNKYAVDGTFSEVAYDSIGHLTGTTFGFRGTLQGKWKERIFLFVDGSARTFRVVHDPTSSLNVQALNSLELLSNH